MVFSILSIGPASAVQIESVNQFNTNGDSSNKSLENNNITFDDNINTIINANNSTGTNQTAINETKSNETIELNGTISNNTNGTGINQKFYNDTNGTGINQTFNNTTNNIGDTFDTKAAVLGTLGSVVAIGALVCGAALGLAGLCTALPDVTLTKVIAGACLVTAAVAAVVTVGCCIASIFCWWLIR
jgi:hypothetical protein